MSSYKRKYYLHQIMKDANVRVDSNKKTLSLTAEQYDELSTKHLVKLFDLQRTFHYNVQFKIPN